VLDGPNAGDWLVVVTYADASAFEKAQALFAQDSDIQRILRYHRLQNRSAVFNKVRGLVHIRLP
jgi:hypothetical protein